ncbi:hypothetical protein BVC93_25245 [Mycobacterium sp. MS1601]|uniref:hypothetical protein n=1 Tax=Mycobacterium sp. MS1601 TaxID=1936029 RepID=UPI000979346D|nr:hypothetical protein [Mycobacterium sp. MS1601]AQA05162.1 hypothetical protein BVC93_25245 [Mycobacterium sp. MS1601]
MIARQWQRNVLGAAVSVGALAAITTTMLSPGWSDYHDMTHPEHVVPAGESGEAAGQTWRVKTNRFYTASQNRLNPELPEGTLVHVVTVEIDGSDPTGCARAVITDGQQRWATESVGDTLRCRPRASTSAAGVREWRNSVSCCLPESSRRRWISRIGWDGFWFV